MSITLSLADNVSSQRTARPPFRPLMGATPGQCTNAPLTKRAFVFLDRHDKHFFALGCHNVSRGDRNHVCISDYGRTLFEWANKRVEGCSVNQKKQLVFTHAFWSTDSLFKLALEQSLAAAAKKPGFANRAVKSLDLMQLCVIACVIGATFPEKTDAMPAICKKVRNPCAFARAQYFCASHTPPWLAAEECLGWP